MFITAYDAYYEPLKKEFLRSKRSIWNQSNKYTNLYFVFGNVSTLPNPPNLISTVRSVATCDSGDVVFEWGYQTLSAILPILPIVFYDGPIPNPSNPLPISEDSAYEVSINGVGQSFRAFAYCFDNTPTH